MCDALILVIHEANVSPFWQTSGKLLATFAELLGRASERGEVPLARVAELEETGKISAEVSSFSWLYPKTAAADDLEGPERAG